MSGTLKQEGEPVEYTTTVDDNNRVRADRVTGPLGAFVQGERRPQYEDHFENNPPTGY